MEECVFNVVIGVDFLYAKLLQVYARTIIKNRHDLILLRRSPKKLKMLIDIL